MTLDWWLHQAPIWLLRGREWKYAVLLSSPSRSTRPSTLTCLFSGSQNMQSAALAPSASSEALRLS